MLLCKLLKHLTSRNPLMSIEIKAGTQVARDSLANRDVLDRRNAGQNDGQTHQSPSGNWNL